MAIALALLCAATAALPLEAKPAFAVAATDAPVELFVRVPAAAGRSDDQVQLKLTTNVGAISRPQRVGPETFKATFTPPAERFPQVALVHAVAEVGTARETGFLALPIHGRETLKLRASKPHAQVTVQIGQASFGPVAANRKGEVEIPVVVPPGLDRGTVLTVDRLGNRKSKPLPLYPPPFARVRVAVGRVSASASWSDAEPLPIEVYVIDRKGAPSTARGLHLQSSRGELSSLQPDGPGRFVAHFRAPELVEDGRVTLQALMKGEPPGSGADVTLRPGPPSSLEVQFEPQQFVAGSPEPVRVTVVATDERGNRTRAPAGLQLLTDVGTVEAAEDGNGAWLHLPNQLGERTEARVEAVVGELRLEALLPMRPGAPSAGEVQLVRHMARAGGDPLLAQVMVRDAFGNAVPDARLRISSTPQGEASVSASGTGEYDVTYRFGSEAPRGDAVLELKSEEGPLSLSASAVVLPHQRALGVALGAFLNANSNFVAARSAGPSVQVAFRPGRSPFEITVQGGMSFHDAFRVKDDENRSAIKVTELTRTSALLGLRYSAPLGAFLSAYAAIAGGVDWTRSTLTVEDLPIELASSDLDRHLAIRGGAGLSWALGPGRLLGELGGGWSPGKGQVTGNLEGASLAVGYLLEVR